MNPEHWSMRNLSLLVSTLIVGFLLAYLMHVHREFVPIGVVVGTLLPFVIAGLTGVAQTTTV